MLGEYKSRSDKVMQVRTEYRVGIPNSSREGAKTNQSTPGLLSYP